LDLETGDDFWQTNLDMENPQWGSPIAAGQTGIYAYDGMIAFKLTKDDYVQLFDAQINRDRVLASTQEYRDQYGLDDTDLDADARKQALRGYQRDVARQGPLRCGTPAIADGLLYLRLRDCLVCYDLRAK